MNYPIEVYASGAISLGPNVCCDGFLSEAALRVQTHLHTDHMSQFDTSKGNQDIVLSDPTRQLLLCEHNADLPYRNNIKSIQLSQWHEANGFRIMLLPSGHMLGAVQVVVETPEQMRLGYSGDFRWPLSRVIEVDALVVDSTYGSPKSVREFTSRRMRRTLSIASFPGISIRTSLPKGSPRNNRTSTRTRFYRSRLSNRCQCPPLQNG